MQLQSAARVGGRLSTAVSDQLKGTLPILWNAGESNALRCYASTLSVSKPFGVNRAMTLGERIGLSTFCL